MNARPGRPPKTPTESSSTITIRLPAEVKVKLMADAEAVDMSLTEYVVTLIQRGV